MVLRRVLNLCQFVGLTILALLLSSPVLAQVEQIPFEVRHGFLIVVKGQIGERKDLSFVVDTGSTSTILDKRIIEDFPIARESGEIFNYNRKVKVEWINIAELRAGLLKFQNVREVVADLQALSHFGNSIDGVIGLDLLRTCENMRVDYRGRILSLTFASQATRSKSPNRQAMIVRLPVQGQTVRAIVDTGIEEGIVYSDRLRRNVPQLKFASVIGNAHLGPLTGSRATLSGLQLGDSDRNFHVFLLNEAPESLPAEIDGYVGIAVLHADWVELDFKAQALRWQPMSSVSTAQSIPDLAP